MPWRPVCRPAMLTSPALATPPHRPAMRSTRHSRRSSARPAYAPTPDRAQQRARPEARSPHGPLAARQLAGAGSHAPAGATTGPRPGAPQDQQAQAVPRPRADAPVLRLSRQSHQVLACRAERRISRATIGVGHGVLSGSPAGWRVSTDRRGTSRPRLTAIPQSRRVVGDSRSQSRTSCELRVGKPGSGGPGEFHPRAPTDPGVTLSRHRALLTLAVRLASTRHWLPSASGAAAPASGW
jgi:hypothetical protein